jgi:hypothetical protein
VLKNCSRKRVSSIVHVCSKKCTGKGLAAGGVRLAVGLGEGLLSQRDSVIVAWHFSAWDGSQSRFRPVRERCDRLEPQTCFSSWILRTRPDQSVAITVWFVTNQGATDHTVPYGTALVLRLTQALKCQATITESLRDRRPWSGPLTANG